MWGTHPLSSLLPPVLRFIPTHVGNTARSSRAPGPVSVHPHACGEHTEVSEGTQGSLGSSPRMWGTRRGAPGLFRRARFIPTHVGNTATGWSGGSTSTVHPHACGEHAVTLALRSLLPVHPHACGEHEMEYEMIYGYEGSSPRMWGTRSGSPSGASRYRFIPTHVGNTLRLMLQVRNVTVHPHACGEHMEF